MRATDRQPDRHHAEQDAAATTAKSVVREAGYGLGIPDAAQTGQAAQRAEARLGAGRERREARSA